MKKVILIVIIIIVLLILAVWGYFLLYGTPKTVTDVFTNFGFGVDDGLVYEPTTDTPPTTNPSESSNLPSLRQLTTNHVAGAIMIGTIARYVERGTGHLYDIDITARTEKLVSGTVVPFARTAAFSQDGSTVAISAGERAEEIVIGQLSEGSGLVPIALPAGAYAAGFATSSRVIYYLLPEGVGASVFTYNFENRNSERLLSLPFREVRALWGDPTYLYTTPSARAKGFVYQMSNNQLQFVTNGDYALMPIPVTDKVIITRRRDNVLTPLIQPDTTLTPEISLLPEKCVARPYEKYLLFCAAPEKPITGNQPDDWYMGKRSFSDNLYLVDATNGSVSLLNNLLLTSGREIDVHSMAVSADGRYLYFVNKNDSSLWLFDTSF